MATVVATVRVVWGWLLWVVVAAVVVGMAATTAKDSIIFWQQLESKGLTFLQAM